MSSYFAAVTAKPDSLLLGGVKIHVSSRFSTRDMAALWASIVVEQNEKSGRGVERYLIYTSNRKPEIS